MFRIAVRGNRSQRWVLDWLRSLAVPDISWQGRAVLPDALVLLPEPKGSLRLLTPHAPVVVAPGDCIVDAPQIITYGYGARETMTYSSLDVSSPVLAIQREIVTLAGARLERQEIPLKAAKADAELTLALAGALLIAGVGAEELWDIRFEKPLTLSAPERNH